MSAETGDPSFYKRPHDEVSIHLQQLAELESRIESAFARWAELERA